VVVKARSHFVHCYSAIISLMILSNFQIKNKIEHKIKAKHYQTTLTQG
jgi:hypothetical protein